MSKPKTKRALSETEAKAFARYVKVSARKLNLVAGSIRGLKADKAVASLTFNTRRVAGDVKKVLQSAIANAENNHDLDVDDLVVAEASVGKNLVMKRFHARARGRGVKVVKLWSNLTVVVRERVEAAEEAK